MNETEITKAESVPGRIAEVVREQSLKLAKLTALENLGKLVPELTPDNIDDNLTEMVKDERYQDIKSVTGSTGTIYLCSETHITREQAKNLIENEDIKTMIAEKIREESRDLIKITNIETINEVISGYQSGQVESDGDILGEEPDTADYYLAEVAGDERYQDIKSIVASTGAVFCYSEHHITKNYAEILLRAQENDPYAVIATTVRDESRIYPRPTSIDFFREPIFNINLDELEDHVDNILEHEDYKDIKLITASTGNRYLYSSSYLEKVYAQSLVEWKEVGEEENP
ncbi:MAG: hypothetical protein JSU58_04250 [Dehalococcoidales bacterium]|nr:MAG: hypothetical protein JSU58_04250 [Dehalococcoidales bacterium]